MRSIRAIVPLAVLAGLLLVPTRAPAATCSKLPNTAQLRAALRAAHAKLTDQPFTGPRKSQTYAGRCGTRAYALASFKDPELGFQDQPERFTRRGASQWKDRGDRRGGLLRGAEGAAPHLGPSRPLLRLSGERGGRHAAGTLSRTLSKLGITDPI